MRRSSVLVRVDDGTPVHRFTARRGRTSIGWTSPDQLVYITDLGDISAIQAFNVTSRLTYDVAPLQGRTWGWLAASGAMC